MPGSSFSPIIHRSYWIIPVKAGDPQNPDLKVGSSLALRVKMKAGNLKIESTQPASGEISESSQEEERALGNLVEPEK